MRHKGLPGLTLPNNPSIKQVCVYLIDLFRGKLMPPIEKRAVPENSKEKVLAGLMVLVNKAQSGLSSKVPRKYPPLPDMKS